MDVVGQADAFDGGVFQGEAEAGEFGGEGFAEFLRQQHLVGGHVEEGGGGVAEQGGELGYGDVAQLLFKLVAGVAFHHAADLLEEGFGVADAVAVHAEGADLHRAEFGVAHGYGLGGAPFAGELLFGVEEVNVGFERGFK